MPLVDGFWDSFVDLDALVVFLACSYVVISSIKPSSVITRPLGLGLGFVGLTVEDAALQLQLQVQGGVGF